MTYVPTKKQDKAMSDIDNRMSFDVTLSQINHYQKKLEKYATMGETEKLLCCIHKLKYLPVTVNHLEITGVGKSINALRHRNGIIGEKARLLVQKWKLMVAEEEPEEQVVEYSAPSYSNASPANIENEEEYDPSDEGDRLQIQEEQGGEEEEELTSNVTYNPGGNATVDDEDENCNGYDPRTSREDYLSVGVDTTHASYHPSSKSDAEEPHEDSPDRSSLPNGDSHSDKLKKDKSHRSEDEGRHKKKKHKSRENHEEKHKSRDSSNSSSNHKKSKHKSSKTKDKRKDKEKESSKSKRRSSHLSPSKTHSSHHKEKEVPHSKNSHSPLDVSPNDHPSNSSEKKRHKDTDDEQEIVNKKSKEHSHSKEKETNNLKYKDKKSHKSTKSSKDERESSKRKREDGTAESSTGFEAALMGMDATATSKKKKKKSKEKEMKEAEFEAPSYSKSSKPEQLNVDYGRDHLPQLPSTFEEETVTPLLMTHYKPLPHIPQRPPAKDPFTSQMTNEEALKFMFSSKNKKQRRIYAGKCSGLLSVPSLFNICIRVLQENIDALEATGGIPFDLLRPVLEKASPQQLLSLEDYNAYLLEDTDVLWASHCRKHFKNKQREDMETWREMFFRCTDEHHEKMRSVTEILQKKYITKAPPKKTTQLTYSRPPKSVARAQAKYGTASVSAPQVRPAKSDESQKAGSSSSSSSGNLAPKPDRPFPNKPPPGKKNKVAPLMGKARQLMKVVCRR